MKTIKNIAIYPGSFDPITYGHIDLIERAAKLFDQLIITIADNSTKQYCLTINERQLATQQALNHLKNVTVECCDQLLVDFAKEKQATILLRGLRSMADFEFECQLAGMNRQLAPEIETVFMTPSKDYHCISSSLVKEIAASGHNTELFTPAAVSELLINKFCR